MALEFCLKTCEEGLWEILGWGLRKPALIPLVGSCGTISVNESLRNKKLS
jgi:hypothetical protein